MKEQFVPYNLALELKELGFDEPCIAYYILIMQGQIIPSFYLNKPTSHGSFDMFFKHNSDPETKKWNNPDCKWSAPLWQQAFDWFRKEYNIEAWVQPYVRQEENFKYILPDNTYSYFIFRSSIWVADEVDFPTIEEAKLACLEKLIEIVKNK